MIQTPTSAQNTVVFTLTEDQLDAVQEAVLHALTYDTPKRETLEQALSALRWARLLQPLDLNLDFTR